MATPFSLVLRPRRSKLEAQEAKVRQELSQFLSCATADELRLFVGYLKEKDPENSLIPTFDRLVKLKDREEQLRPPENRTPAAKGERLSQEVH